FVVQTPAGGIAGSALSIMVTAFDAYGNTATGYRGTVHFTSSDAQAGLPSDYTFTGSDAGIHTFSNAVTLKTAGAQTVTATDTASSSVIGTSSAITVTAGAATHFTVQTPASSIAGNALSVTITALDAYGNPAGN